MVSIMARAYYNENDPFAANWLRNLIDAGLIAPGDVDERSIVDVQPSDLHGYERCHFFAGIGGWDYALQLAGWPDDRPVWTGSCPCQPFSSAGKGRGTADERHLWPEFARLIRECKPPVVFGEQVSSAGVVGKTNARSSVWPQVSETAPQQRLDSSCKGTRWQEGLAFRPGQPPAGDSIPDRSGALRGFGASAEPGWWPNVGQPIARQDRPLQGVCDCEYQGGLPCGEQCVRRLGGRENARDCAFNHGKASASLQRAIREAGGEAERAVGNEWFSRVCLDLEAAHYRVGSCDLPAAGVNAPHIRQRLFWVADAGCDKLSGDTRAICATQAKRDSGWELNGREHIDAGDGREVRSGVADAASTRSLPAAHVGICAGEEAARSRNGKLERRSGLGNAINPRLEGHGQPAQVVDPQGRQAEERHGSASGAWSNFDLVRCVEPTKEPGRYVEKWRRIEPGLVPLAHGLPGRVGRLRGYGNAIVPQVAAEFITAYMEAQDG